MSTIVKADAKPTIGTTPTIVNDGLNVELLQKTLQFIKENPRTWVQTDWFLILDSDTKELVPHLVDIEVEEINSCGTAFCFAGHAALMEGFPAPPKSNFSEWRRLPEGADYPETASDFARKRLGLDWNQADILFHPGNSMEDLQILVDALIENPDISAEDMEALTSWYDRDDDSDDYYDADDPGW